MLMTFKNTFLIIIVGIVFGASVETQCMRRVLPSLLSRAYSVPKMPQAAVEKIDQDIAEQKLLKAQIYSAQRNAVVKEIKEVSFYTALFGSCYVPVYGLKSLLVSGGITAALVPFIIVSYPLTPHDKRLIAKYTSAIQALEAQKVELFKKHSH